MIVEILLPLLIVLLSYYAGGYIASLTVRELNDYQSQISVIQRACLVLVFGCIFYEWLGLAPSIYWVLLAVVIVVLFVLLTKRIAQKEFMYFFSAFLPFTAMPFFPQATVITLAGLGLLMTGILHHPSYSGKKKQVSGGIKKYNVHVFYFVCVYLFASVVSYALAITFIK